MLVVVAGMGSDKVLMAGLVDAAITGDVIVVASEAEAGGKRPNLGPSLFWLR